MDMLEGVGRRLDSSDGKLLDLGVHSLNGRERNVLFRNRGDGHFDAVGWVNGADRLEDGRGLAVFDANEDGHQDLVIRNYAMPAGILVNRGSSGNWLRLDLEGTRSNRDAIGAKVRLRSGDRWQTRVVQAGSGYLSSSSPILHFGLGEQGRADEIRIEWPSGATSQLGPVAANQTLAVQEPGTPPATSKTQPALAGPAISRETTPH